MTAGNQMSKKKMSSHESSDTRPLKRTKKKKEVFLYRKMSQQVETD